MKIYQKFLSENFHFLVVKFSVYLNRHVFVMWRNKKTIYLIIWIPFLARIMKSFSLDKEVEISFLSAGKGDKYEKSGMACPCLNQLDPDDAWPNCACPIRISLSQVLPRSGSMIWNILSEENNCLS